MMWVAHSIKLAHQVSNFVGKLRFLLRRKKLQQQQMNEYESFHVSVVFMLTQSNVKIAITF